MKTKLICRGNSNTGHTLANKRLTRVYVHFVAGNRHNSLAGTAFYPIMSGSTLGIPRGVYSFHRNTLISLVVPSFVGKSDHSTVLSPGRHHSPLPPKHACPRATRPYHDGPAANSTTVRFDSSRPKCILDGQHAERTQTAETTERRSPASNMPATNCKQTACTLLLLPPP